jgi:four helix bundle protein
MSPFLALSHPVRDSLGGTVKLPGMRRGDDLANRLLQFAAAVLRLVARLPSDQPSKDIARQLSRAATAAGANYAEARGAESRQDFVHKLRIADKETRESLYWLSLIAARWDEHETEAGELSLEADELVAILTASVRTAVARSTS